MIDLVKKAMFAGVGAAVVTKDKVEESVQELVQKGKISSEEAQKLSERIVEKGEKETEEARQEASKLFTEFLNRAQVATQDQIDALEQRVRDLEGRWHREFPNSGEE